MSGLSEKQMLVSILKTASTMLNRKNISEPGKAHASRIYKTAFFGLIELYDMGYDEVTENGKSKKRLIIDGETFCCE